MSDFKPCPPPNYGLLSNNQAEIIKGIMQYMVQVKFSGPELKAKEQEMLAQMHRICKNSNDWSTLINFLELMVNWYRLPAFWLTYLFQRLTNDLQSCHHIYACWLYSDAYLGFNSDLAVNSLEVAYDALIQSRKNLSEDYFNKAEKQVRLKLKCFHDFYRHFCTSFKYEDCNPLVHHLYSIKTQNELMSNFPEIISSMADAKSEDFLAIINRCQDIDSIYYRILARRYLGNIYQNIHDLKAASEQFQLGLSEALEYGLETEIGHFYRLYGYVLKSMRNFPEAEQQFVKAYNFESFTNYSYWKALSAMELGDVRWQMAISHQNKVIYGKINPEPALDAYYQGNYYFEYHLRKLTLPLDRAIKKQMFRSYIENILIAAQIYGSLKILLTVIESNGPYSAMEVIKEVKYASELPDEAQKDFFEAREIFHRHLNSVPEHFEDYIKSLSPDFKFRYLITKTKVGLKNLFKDSTESVNALLSQSLPGVVFLFFNVGCEQVNMVFVDMETGKMISSFVKLHDFEIQYSEYHRSIKAADSLPNSGPITQVALDKLLAGYEKLFGKQFEVILPVLKNRHLKIFPRLQMNDVPFHALRIGGKRLMEHCTVSYGISVSTFLAIHKTSNNLEQGRVLSVYDDIGAPIYKALFDQKHESYINQINTLTNPAWPELLKKLKEFNPTDLFFACHGNFYPDNPAASSLWLKNGEEKITLTDIFSDLRIKDCRCVLLGACESGLARSDINDEYIGMPSVFLSAGVRYVIGSLWKVNQLASVILLSYYFSNLISEKQNIPLALNRAQCSLMSMSRFKIKKWLKINLPDNLPKLNPLIDAMEEKPFQHPYYWAGFYVMGDI